MLEIMEYKKKIMIKKSFYLCLIILILMSGCTTTEYLPRKLQAPLEGEWKSTDSKITLSFKDGNASGSDGCNRFSGHYERDGNSLAIAKNLISTAIGCEAEIMEKADIFRKNLTEVKRYTNDGKILKLIRDDGEILGEFKSVSNSFDRGKYIVQSLNNGKKSVVTIKAGVSIFVELEDEGKMSGFTGCNRFHSTYLLNENKIALSKLITTRKMCPIDNMKAEKDFIKAMQNGVKISRKGERWEIRDASDILLMDMIKE